MGRKWLWVLLIIAACGDDSVPGIVCGPGTYDSNGHCLPNLTCGLGTVAIGGECTPIDAAPPMTPPDAFVPDGPTILCGPGTHLASGQCLPNSGTQGYEVRVPQTEIPAQIYYKIPILLLGPRLNPGDTPAFVRLLVVPSNAGTLDQQVLTLDSSSSSGSTYFRPCDGRPSCLEQFHIEMVLDADRQTVLATSDTLETVAPTGIGSPAACLGGGNRMFVFSDNDFVYPGTLLVTEGWFQPHMFDANHQTVDMRIYPTILTGYFEFWETAFSTEQLGQPIQLMEYDNAERWPFESANTPGLDVSGSGRGCNVLTGAFQVQEFVAQGATLQAFTATFLQHCEGGATTLFGCVHVEQ
jgi:hypothetical protein